MTDPKSPPNQAAGAGANPITEDDIAHFLLNTPDFFMRHAEVLASVQFISPHSHRTVSLQERQAEMLREKIKHLESRLMEMIRHGSENIMLSDKIVQWARGLLGVTDAASLPALVAETIKKQFAVPQVTLRLWGLRSEFASLPVSAAVDDELKAFTDGLSDPYCGMNTGFDAVQWLDSPSAAASIALVPLRQSSQSNASFGLLVLASPDTQRFRENMGTDFLERFGEIASAALSPLR